MRDSADAPFDDADVRLLDELSSTLGMLLRRSLLGRACQGRVEPTSPPQGMLILDAELRPTSWTPSFREWLAELPPASTELLPPAVYELGARVLTPAEAATGLPASVRIRSATGAWATLEAALLEGAGRGDVAVTVRTSSADEVVDLLCRTYELTRRERELVALVLDGLATKQLAQALCISPHTVQDHLKAIFAKTGVRSRRELISHLAGRVPAPT